MTSGAVYRTKAAELLTQARQAAKPALKAEFEHLARAYIRLAEQAERNEEFGIAYETPSPTEGELGQ